MRIIELVKGEIIVMEGFDVHNAGVVGGLQIWIA